MKTGGDKRRAPNAIYHSATLKVETNILMCRMVMLSVVAGRAINILAFPNRGATTETGYDLLDLSL